MRWIVQRGSPIKSLQDMGKAADAAAKDKTKGFEVDYDLFGINDKMLGRRRSI